MRITIAAPAKVNLRLRVGAADASGYHDVSTLYCALDLADTVVLRAAGPDDGQTLEVAIAPPLRRPPELGPPDANLALRAARAFAEEAGLDRMPRIRLVKRVPAGGGLGGGSSDAAAVLRALRRLHPRALDGADLLRIAADLGSDVPFFLLGSPLAHGSGRGDLLTPLPPLPARPVVLVLPPFGVDTGEAYGWVDQEREAEEDRQGAGNQRSPSSEGPGSPPDPADDAPEDWDQAAGTARNDFEGPVFRRHPELRDVRDSLRRHGAEPALLAGSGSTVFGIFDERPSADAAAAALREAFPSHRVLVTATRAR